MSSSTDHEDPARTNRRKHITTYRHIRCRCSLSLPIHRDWYLLPVGSNRDGEAARLVASPSGFVGRTPCSWQSGITLRARVKAVNAATPPDRPDRKGGGHMASSNE